MNGANQTDMNRTNQTNMNGTNRTDMNRTNVVRIISNPTKEYEHQMNIFAWSMLNRAKYPELKYLAHVRNEEKAGAREVAIEKSLGTKKGFPDLILPVPRGEYGCLLIELKTEKGRASEAQKWWIEKMNEVGNCARVCRGWRVAVALIEWYLEGAAGDAPV